MITDSFLYQCRLLCPFYPIYCNHRSQPIIPSHGLTPFKQAVYMKALWTVIQYKCESISEIYEASSYIMFVEGQGKQG